jgi:hypothetical protein
VKYMGNEWVPCCEKLPQTSGWYSVLKGFLIGDGEEESLLWYGDIGNGNHFYIYESPKRENVPLGQRVLELDCLVTAWKPKIC